MKNRTRKLKSRRTRKTRYSKKGGVGSKERSLHKRWGQTNMTDNKKRQVINALKALEKSNPSNLFSKRLKEDQLKELLKNK
jgi:hypothetical protein